MTSCEQLLSTRLDPYGGGGGGSERVSMSNGKRLSYAHAINLSANKEVALRLRVDLLYSFFSTMSIAKANNIVYTRATI